MKKSSMFKLTQLEKAWINYDVANSAFTLLIVTILPIFSNAMALSEGYTANQATVAWSYVASLSTLVFVLFGPTLGAIGDHKGQKKRMFSIFLAIGVAACVFMGLCPTWVLFLVVFFVAKVGYNGTIIFYDGMINDVTSEENVDRVSSIGYALGYIGSCIPFVLGLAAVLLAEAEMIPISMPWATTIAILVTAVWWVVFTMPLLKRYKQRYFVSSTTGIIKDSFKKVFLTIKNIKKNKVVFMFLLAFFFYIDGVYTIIEIATPYGISMGIGTTDLLLALLTTQIVAFPFAIIFGRLASKFKTRSLLQAIICVYILITVFAFQLDKAWEFWALAIAIGTVQGGIQALSRSYFARIIPKENSNEFFGFYDIFGKGASVVGTFCMGFAIQVSGKPNMGIIPIFVMFIIGLVILNRLPKNKADEIAGNS